MNTIRNQAVDRPRMGLMAIVIAAFALVAPAVGTAQQQPSPLFDAAHPVDWWMVFKLNADSFPGCGGSDSRVCPFGGDPQNYPHFGQQYVAASSASPAFQMSSDCVGSSAGDPVGATFGEIYDGALNYVIWNDQLYDDPKIAGCTQECGSPWGHSKGALAWDDAGEGFVLQVTTPSWPRAGGNAVDKGTDGNTLGCVHDNNVLVSQDFFSLKLNKADILAVLSALQNASVVTDIHNPQIVRNGSNAPPDIQQAVSVLGVKSASTTATVVRLSTGVTLISKPSQLHVPPWQMVSALLGGVSLRTATWWAAPQIKSTTADSSISCWDNRLGKPGAVDIATTGQYMGKTLGFDGIATPEGNHAKIGVSTSGASPLVIFGDMNQQGTLSGANCGSSQDGRGGLFYVVNDPTLFANVTALLKGSSAPLATP